MFTFRNATIQTTGLITCFAYVTVCVCLPGCADETSYPAGRYTSGRQSYWGEATGHPGFVRSPYAPHYIVDVRRLRPGDLCMDTKTNQVFRIPYDAFSENRVVANEAQPDQTPPASSDDSGPSWGTIILGVLAAGAAASVISSTLSPSQPASGTSENREQSNDAFDAQQQHQYELENRDAVSRGEPPPHLGSAGY